ncbi:tetraprenyl-beta-curcumene synthase family protein [Peribacillus sp. B-H-3]|uniref:tetraprenyl-beta-curcumene synthase family protein n=1 Tax=Peribacillus sp. B-H-3 TaxID=3400420 RepID=UPI003B024ACF
MIDIFYKIFPFVDKELAHWRKRAEQIPDPELKKQALSSIGSKAFHCQGGAIFALLADNKLNRAETIKFIVGYQTMSDYLDNLCDRSTSLDPKDFSALHEAMQHSIDPGLEKTDYYRFRTENNDGGYLHELVDVCQSVLRGIRHYSIILPYIGALNSYYCELQVHKHVTEEERAARLMDWAKTRNSDFPALAWYEFSACAGSTLGIFCLCAYSIQKDFSEEKAISIFNGYFPYIQGLHILLDYFIDQEEDKKEGDLNFCSYYRGDDELMASFASFISKSLDTAANIPDTRFHQLILKGLLGLYLSDSKIKSQKNVRQLVRKVIKLGGRQTYFFYGMGRVYNMLRAKA